MHYLRATPRDEYLERVDTVFLFGAGTSAHMKLSASEGSPHVPMDTNFFEAIREGVLEKWCHSDILNVAKLARQRVFDALPHVGLVETDLYPKAGERYPRIRLEELFCRLEMLKMLGRCVCIREHENPELVEWREAWKHPSETLRDLIAIVMAHGRPPEVEDPFGYTDFTGRILRGHDQKNANAYAILTLNYEIGLERAIHEWSQRDVSTFAHLRELSLAQPERDTGVEVGLHSLFHYSLPHRSLPQTTEAMPILKLHGSCNWGYCPECENVLHLNVEVCTPGSKIGGLAGRPSQRQACGWHSADMPLSPRYAPHIVPPTWTKWMGDPTTRHIWREAYALLNRCKKLFIVGTSLPGTDVHLRHLIHMAFDRGNGPDQVYVVNPVSEEERGEYAKRAEEALGIAVPDENCLWDSFETNTTLDWIFDRVHTT